MSTYVEENYNLFFGLFFLFFILTIILLSICANDIKLDTDEFDFVLLSILFVISNIICLLLIDSSGIEGYQIIFSFINIIYFVYFILKNNHKINENKKKDETISDKAKGTFGGSIVSCIIYIILFGVYFYKYMEAVNKDT
jgi:hypothetical protein